MSATQAPPIMNPEKPTEIRWLIFALACAASWLLYLHRYSWGVIKSTFADEHPELTATDLGWLDSAFNLTYALGQVPGGLAGDVLGARAVLPVLIILWSLAGVGVVWLASFWALFAVRSTFGLTQAGAYPVLSKVTRNWFPLSGRTAVQGAVAASGRIGAACCPLLLATVLMGLLGLGWQTALLALAVPGLALAAAFWLLVRNSPAEHPRTNEAERELVQGIPDRRGDCEPSPAAATPRSLARDPLSLLTLAMLLVYAFASTFQDQLYVNWIPMFLDKGRGMKTALMGLVAPLPLLGGALGSVLGGWLNDALIRAGWPRRWVRSGVALTGKLAAGGLVLLSVFMPDGLSAMLVLMTARVFGDWSLATQWGAITDMGGRASGTLFGLVNTVGAIGGFVAGPALGHLKQHYGWEGLFGGVSGMCLLSALTWLLIDCTRPLVSERGEQPRR